jgi:hypothetical protein
VSVDEVEVATGLSLASGAALKIPLRVATWNLNHWRQPLLPTDTRRGAWAHLAQGIGAQVVLVQEAVPPLDMPATVPCTGRSPGTATGARRS